MNVILLRMYRANGRWHCFSPVQIRTIEFFIGYECRSLSKLNGRSHRVLGNYRRKRLHFDKHTSKLSFKLQMPIEQSHQIFSRMTHSCSIKKSQPTKSVILYINARIKSVIKMPIFAVRRTSRFHCMPTNKFTITGSFSVLFASKCTVLYC